MQGASFVQSEFANFSLNGAPLNNVSFKDAVLTCIDAISCAAAFGPATIFGTADAPVTFNGATMTGIILANRV